VEYYKSDSFQTILTISVLRLLNMELTYHSMEELVEGGLTHEQAEGECKLLSQAEDDVRQQMRQTEDSDEIEALRAQIYEYRDMSRYIKGNYMGPWCRYYNGPSVVKDPGYRSTSDYMRLVAFNKGFFWNVVRPEGDPYDDIQRQYNEGKIYSRKGILVSKDDYYNISNWSS